MKKQILNLGKTLKKEEQQAINGGNKRGCYDEPRTDIPCISNWVYFQGCGWSCMTAPVGPEL